MPVVAAAVVTSIVSCTPSSTASKSAGTTRLTIGLGSAPQSLDPYGAVAPPQTYFFHAVYDGLTAFDPKGRLIAGLATSWRRTTPTQWTLKLRTTATFSNGEKLTATGVKADLDYLMANKAEPASIQVATIKNLSAPAADTLVIDTATADPILMAKLTAVPIPAPREFTKNPKAFTTKAVGTGPYALDSFVAGQNLRLRAATDSWHGTAKLKVVKFVSIPDPATRVSALRSGQLDVAQNIGPDNIQPLKAAGFQIEAVRRGQIQQVMFEVASHPKSPLANKDVRLALNYAVDTDKIIKTVLGGAFTPAHGQVVGDDGVGFDPAVRSYPYDPRKARQMLAAAGYPKGFSATLEMTTGAFPNDKQAYDAVVNYLDAVGVKVSVQTVPLPQFVKALRAGPRAEMFVAGLQYIPELDTAKAMFWWQCGQPPAAKRFCDPGLDSLMSRATSSMDPGTRTDLLRQANARWHADALSIPLWQLTDIWAIRPGVSGWVQRPDAVLDLNLLQANAK